MSLRLYTLGRSAAVVRERAVEPSADLLFAGLLLFGLEPGRDFARRELAELLWPDAGPIRQGSRLRWLLNRLKSLGLPLEATAQRVRVDTRHVRADYTDISSLSLEHIGAVLPGYAPTFSSSFGRWLDQQRDSICGDVLRQLIPRLTAAREADDWHLANAIADAVLRVDVFNEEAVLTLAEAKCRLGSKAQAVASLDAYMEALGEDADELRVPAATLRRRIAAHAQTAEAIPFVGRAREIERLSGVVDGARRGNGGTLLVTGPVGIGKTRLIDETLSRQAVHRLQVGRVRWESDVSGAEHFSRLAKTILSLPGALGASPESFERVAAVAEIDARQERSFDICDSSFPSALIDVLDAAATEVPVVLVVDDVTALEPGEADLLRKLAAWTPAHSAALFVVTRRTRTDPVAGDLPVLRVGSLAIPDAATLANELLAHADRSADDDTLEKLVARGAGNPLYLRELAWHWSRSGSLDDTPPSLLNVLTGTLAGLSWTATRVLETAVVLAGEATTDRIDRILQLPRTQLLDALTELESAGTVASDDCGILYGHALWTEAIVASAPASVVHLLKKYADERHTHRTRRVTPRHTPRRDDSLRFTRRGWS